MSAPRALYEPWPEGARRSWGWVALLVAVGLYILSSAPLVIAIVIYGGTSGVAPEAIEARLWSADSLRVLFPALLSQFALWLVLVLVWVKLVERRSLKSIGFCGPNFAGRYLRGIMIGAGLVLVLGAVYAGLSALSGGSERAFLSAAPMDPSLLMNAELALVLGLIALAFLFQGAVEEVAFRGWLMSTLAARWPIVLATAVSGGLFAVLHVHVFGSGALLGAAAMAGIGLTGLFFALYALAERAIAGVLGAHGAFNASIVIASLAGEIAAGAEDLGEAFGQVFQRATAMTAPETAVAGPQIWTQAGVFGVLCLVLIARLAARRREGAMAADTPSRSSVERSDPRKDPRRSLEALFDQLLSEEGALNTHQPSGSVTVDDLLERLGHRSYGPLLIVICVIAIMPVVGALPGISYGAAFLALAVSIQFLFSQPKLWLPGRLKRAKISRQALKTGVDKSRPVLRWVDRFIAPRFSIAFRQPLPRLAALLCVILSVLMVIYAAVPGGVVIPAVAIFLIALGLTTNDGLVAGLGALAGIGAIIGSAWLVTRVF